jgi:hypothetical protein
MAGEWKVKNDMDDWTGSKTHESGGRYNVRTQHFGTYATVTRWILSSLRA